MVSASDELKAPADVTSGDARSPPSDNDERPVRQQLKDTSIDPSNHKTPAGDSSTAASGPEQGSGRKRSFEEARGETDDGVENGDGPRKRSRESTPEDVKKDSAAAPASDNVSEPAPQDPVPATPKDLAPDESSPGTLDSPEVEIIVISDSESEDSVSDGKPEVLESPQEIIEISSDSESESEFELVEVPEVLEVISISDSDSESGSESEFEIVEVPEENSISDSDSDSLPDYEFYEKAQAPTSSPIKEESPESDSNSLPDYEVYEEAPAPTSAPTKEASSETDSDSLPDHEVYEEAQAPNSAPTKEASSESDSDSLPDYEVYGEPQAPTSAPTEEESSESVELKESETSERTRENTPEPKIPGVQTEGTAQIEPSSSGLSRGQETHHSVENDNTNTTSQDTENHPPADATNNDDAKALKKKRSLEQLEEDEAKKPEETGTKRHRDNSQERETQAANAFAQSAFANTAASSPFAALGGSTATTEKPASTSAFASSALGSFAGSESSPFGSLGSSNPSVFKSGSGMSGFGSSSTSGFGSLKSGFAGVGGGFAAAAKSGGLTNFASPNAPATLGGEPKASKPIGADESDDEGSDNDEGEETSTFEADKTDERFYEQTIETGEEEEENLFACKGKLFHFSSGEWKERGVGTFKINARTSETGKQTGRMIMRADGALRVMLNSPVFKGMTFGDAKNQEPTSKQILLASNEEGRTVPLLLRVGNEALAKDLYVVIKDLLDGE